MVNYTERAALHKYIATLEYERDALRREVELLNHRSRDAENLLAVIHRDSGRYTGGIGFERSCIDAASVVANLRYALARIASDPHCQYGPGGQYAIGVADGHRCAAQHARDALDSVKPA